jgi:tRNA(adenine34) deaminase
MPVPPSLPDPAAASGPSALDEQRMGAALAEARAAAQRGEVPVGAIVVDAAGAILARAGNACEATRDATAHAEILAIRAAGRALGSWRLEGCRLYVTLEPCPMCMGAALNARLDGIVYGAREPKAGACGSIVDLSAPRGYNHRLVVQGGVLAAESSALLVDFFRALRRTRRAAPTPP